MKRVTIDIDDDYAGILSITAVGFHIMNVKVASDVIDIEKTNYIGIDSTGRATEKWIEEEGSDE